MGSLPLMNQRSKYCDIQTKRHPKSVMPLSESLSHPPSLPSSQVKNQTACMPFLKMPWLHGMSMVVH